MKRHILGRLGALAVVLTCVTTALMGGTLAKYTTTVSGTDTATVAKFAFGAKSGAVDYAASVEDINIFNTTNLNDKVAEGKIAPGCIGSFDVVLDNSGSEVAVKVESTVTVTNVSDINLKFCIGSLPSDDSGYTIASSDLPAELKKAIDGDLELNAAAKTVNVYWKWIDGTDTGDTALGTAGTAEATVKIDVTATQDQGTASTP